MFEGEGKNLMTIFYKVEPQLLTSLLISSCLSGADLAVAFIIVDV